MIPEGETDVRQRLSRVVVGLVLAAVLSGCPKKSENAELVCDRSAYIAQSSEFSPDEGEGIDETTSENPIVTGYFGKKYNQDWLTAVSRASILDTLDYVRSKGVDVYHMSPISDRSALPMGSTDSAPWDLDREWRRADQPAAGAPCGFLAGLYLGKGTRELPSVRSRSAILVREDAARWTLVHEFMHHNFKVQAAADGYDDNVVQQKRITLLKSIDELRKNHSISNKEYTERLFALFLPLVEVADQLVVQYQFEEVTVEATLQDAYLRGDLRYVPFGAFQNASWYIAHSKKNAEDMYAGMTATYDELNRLTATNGLMDEWHQLGRYVELRDRRLAQLDEVIAKRQEFLMGHGFVGALDSTPTTGYAPCAHAREVEDQMREIGETLRAAADRG